jgi:hypothetical protein
MGTRQIEALTSKTKKDTKKHVLSFRVDESEWTLLKKATSRTGVDISTLLRQTLKEVLGPGPQG